MNPTACWEVAGGGEGAPVQPSDDGRPTFGDVQDISSEAIVNVFPFDSSAEARLRILRELLAAKVTPIRLGCFAKFGGEKVIAEFEAALASNYTDESLFECLLELALPFA